MDDKEVVIRTMDIGSDKKADWLPMEKEINPADHERLINDFIQNIGEQS